MPRCRTVIPAVLILVLLLGWRPGTGAEASQPAAPLSAQSVVLETVTRKVEQPTLVTHARDGSGRLFVLEKQGRILVFRPETAEPSVFLDIGALVGSGGSEQGLLGLAFHPRYAANGLFFVDYTDRTGAVVVARYHVSGDSPDVADPNDAQTILRVEKPSGKHNGGMLAFGPEGYLYISLGDGGLPGDPNGNAQKRSVLLGKLLRIDVDNGQPYAIPADNPYVGDSRYRPEVWAYGLRNPWRFSFDRATGDLYIGDVGNTTWEEVDVQRAGTGGGLNFGWNEMEGLHCYPARSTCNVAAYVQPVTEYDRAQGCSIIGGHVYRGSSYPSLQSLYFFGDYCSGRIWTLQEIAPGQWNREEVATTPLGISSFGEDEAGELYLTNVADGAVYRLKPAL